MNVACLTLLSEDVRHPRDDGVGVFGSHGDLVLPRLLPRVSQVTPILWATPSFFVRFPASMGFTPMGHPCTFFTPGFGRGQGMESSQQTDSLLAPIKRDSLLLLQARRTHLPPFPLPFPASLSSGQGQGTACPRWLPACWQGHCLSSPAILRG